MAFHRVASGQGKVKEKIFFNLSEMSGYSAKIQGKYLNMGKSGEKQGGKSLASVLYYVIAFPYKSFLRRKCACWTQFFLFISVETWYLVFCFTDQFSFALPGSKISYYALKNHISIFGLRNFVKDNHQNLLHRVWLRRQCWRACELALIWLFLFSIYICHDKNFGMVSFCQFRFNILSLFIKAFHLSD